MIFVPYSKPLGNCPPRMARTHTVLTDKKYSTYEATQKQRQIETALHKVKREVKAINKQYSALAKKADSMYNTGSEAGNVDAYIRDLPIRHKIQNEYSHEMNVGRQNGHYAGTNEHEMYVQKQQRQGLYGPSVVTATPDELKELFNQYSGTGILERVCETPAWDEKETITFSNKPIGYTVNTKTGEKIETTCFTIHYSHKKGWHIVPTYADMKGAKDEYDPKRGGKV